MASKVVVQNMEGLTEAAETGAISMLERVLNIAFHEWRQFEDIHPPHFVGTGAPSQEILRKRIRILNSNEALQQHVQADDGAFSVENIEIRNASFCRAEWMFQKQEVKKNFQRECRKYEEYVNPKKISFRAAIQQRELNSRVNLDLGTIPPGEISKILVNPDPMKSNLIIYGRERRAQRIQFKEKTDPADHGFYLTRKSAAETTTLIKLGLERIVMKGVENPAAYEYVVYASVGQRKVQIIEYNHFDGETIMINRTIPLCFLQQDCIFITMLRRTSMSARDEEVCLQVQIPFNSNITEQQNEVLSTQRGKFKIYYNYTLHRGMPGNTHTLDSFGSRLSPGSIVGYRKEEEYYGMGMVVGMNPQGSQVIVEPGVVNTPQKWSLHKKREMHEILYLDLNEVILEGQEDTYCVPTYWLDEYEHFLSPSVRNEDQNGISSYEWTLQLQFTFPSELTTALLFLQNQIRIESQKARLVFFNTLEPYRNIGKEIMEELPLLGHLEVAVFSLTNIEDSRYGDKYSVELQVVRENEAYSSPEVKHEEIAEAIENMESWISGSHEKCETEKADIRREKNKELVRWDSDFSSHFDIGSFYADLSERKYIYFHLWRRREKKRQRIRTGRVKIEDLMSLSRPLQLKYLHLKLSDQEYYKKEEKSRFVVTSECLYLEFQFYPSEETIERRGLDRRYYDDTAGMIELMRERRRLEPQLTNRYDTVVRLGSYEPNMINKFFKSKFYETRDEDLIFQYNSIHDVFTLEREELDLRERVSVQPMLRPPIEQWTFKMRQHRLWQISLQRNLFYASYGYSKYKALHQKEAERINQEPHFDTFMTYRNLQDEGGMDPLLTIDINLKNPESQLFSTMYNLVKRGIPKHFRFKLWFNLLNCSALLYTLREALNIEDVYQYFLQEAATHKSTLLELIDQDLSSFQTLPVAPNIPPPSPELSNIKQMRAYASDSEKSIRTKDIHVKGAIRLVLRAYAMYIEHVNKERKKPLVYHRGLIWIVFRLVHGGIVDSLGNAFKLLLGLSNELEVIFQRSEPTLLLNKLETEQSSFSNLCIEDFMLRLQAALDVLYPALSRKIKNLGLPLQYYIGSKFLAFFSDATFPSQHIYLIWDLAIFYSAIQDTRFVYGNVLLLGIALFFFQNALKTVGEKQLYQIQHPHQLKYLIDNPLVLSLNIMNLPTFSERVTTLFESLFPANILGSFISKAATIERRYDELHAAYRREFSKNFFHNEATLAHINMTPQNPKTEPLSPQDYMSIENEVRGLKVRYSKKPKIKVKVTDYNIVKRNVEEAFQQVLRPNCRFILGVGYGDGQVEKLFEIPQNGKQRATASFQAEYSRENTLHFRLYCSGFCGYNLGDEPSAEQVTQSPTKKSQMRILQSTVMREVQAAEKDDFLESLRNQEYSARFTHLLARYELNLDSNEQNSFYKGWESLSWVAGEQHQRKAKENILLALPPAPSLQVALISFQPHKELNDQNSLKLQRSMQCNLPQVANFSDPHFENEEEFIETMMVSQRERVRELLSNEINDPIQSDWIINQNFPIIMPPYNPIKLKLKNFTSLGQKDNQATEQFKALPKDVPLSLEDIDSFQQQLLPQDLAFLSERYIGGENVQSLLLALSHEGPNFEQNRKYFAKVKEYFKLKWKKEEIAPSRLVPVSLRELLSILLLRSQFSFSDLGSKLLDLIRTNESTKIEISYEEACSFIEEVCRRLMVPIPGFQLRNWVQSALFSSPAQILKATILTSEPLSLSSPEVDVTSLLQRYLNFCHERIGSKVIFLPGLSALSEFKSSIKKIKPPRLLVINFSTIRGSIHSEAFVIDKNGQIVQKESVQDCLIWNSYFSLEAVRENYTTLSSLLSLPFLSDWLRMEVSLSSTKSLPRVCDFSLQVANKTFSFSRGMKRNHELPQAVRLINEQNTKHISNKCELGELLEVDTLSDIRYRIRRYLHHTQDAEQLKEMESYVFTEENANLIQLHQFTPLGRMFEGSRGIITLHLNYPRRADEEGNYKFKEIGPNGYALFIQGDGTSTFKVCRVEQDRHQRPGEEELYRIFYDEKIELRTRKEIILQEYDRRQNE